LVRGAAHFFFDACAAGGLLVRVAEPRFSAGVWAEAKMAASEINPVRKVREAATQGPRRGPVELGFTIYPSYARVRANRQLLHLENRGGRLKHMAPN
jgi:hypothetical protein